MLIPYYSECRASAGALPGSKYGRVPRHAITTHKLLNNHIVLELENPANNDLLLASSETQIPYNLIIIIIARYICSISIRSNCGFTGC